jgi:NAD(P)-dependent dehydrogenase (short-subunit alcohol dehydrogenase family)
MLACKHAIAAMMRSRTPGAVVNVGSTVSAQGAGSSTLYTSCKHALLGFTRAVALDPAHAEAGIRVNCICPGSIRTEMSGRYFPDAADPEAALQDFASWYPSRRLGHPDEVADVIVFLVSDQASLINGAAMMADSGLHARAYQTCERRGV